jgi:hypothetical protein
MVNEIGQVSRTCSEATFRDGPEKSRAAAGSNGFDWGG